MTVALEKVKGRCKLRDLRYSRDPTMSIVAIVRLMVGFLCVCLTFPVSLINNVLCVVRVPNKCFWGSWTSTSWKAKSSFAGVIPERDALIDVRERQEQRNSMTEGRSRMTLTNQGAVPLYLSRVGRAEMGIAAGPIYSPHEIK